MFVRVTLFLFAVAICAGAQNASSPTSPSTSLPPEAQQVATIIGIDPLLQRLNAVRVPGAAQELMVRQQIYNAVLAASLDVDSATAEIDNERAQLSELRGRLESRRDKAVNRTGIANLIIGTGLGIVDTAMQLNSSTAQAGNVIGVVSGSASTGLQLYTIHQQGGGLIAVGRVPNMLAPLFNVAPQLHAAYPTTVWAYLNATPTGLNTSRLAQLKNEWVTAGRIDPAGSPALADQIASLTSSGNRKAGIDLLTNRTAMLDDVRGRILLMKRDLATLLRSVPE